MYVIKVIIINESWVYASYSGSKVAKVLVPKVHINGKINVKMKKNVKNQC
jgi:hypothetical protein